jgi:hypothetical protein
MTTKTVSQDPTRARILEPLDTLADQLLDLHTVLDTDADPATRRMVFELSATARRVAVKLEEGAL